MNYVASFYRFLPVSDVTATCARLEASAVELGLLGSVLVAQEGVNGALCGARGALNDFFLRQRAFEFKPTFSSAGNVKPFRRLRVRSRAEIVTFGTDIAVQDGATRVDPREWNALLANERVRVIDVRNDYEVQLGKFSRAINPQTSSFSQFREFVERELAHDLDAPVAMYCTGGIRCEKASAWMRERGFKEVSQLQGGILSYFASLQSQPADNHFEGRCLVFDDRVSLDRSLAPVGDRWCSECGKPEVLCAHLTGT